MNRRNKRTSFSQYTYLLDMMEANPRLAANTPSRHYDAKKWKEMSVELNKCPMGPKLSAEEWRKRLNDWKNSTRSKYRRSIASGDTSGDTMSNLEARCMRIFCEEPSSSESTEYEEILEGEEEQEEQEDFIDDQPNAEYQELEPADPYPTPVRIDRADSIQRIRLQNPESVVYEVQNILLTPTPVKEEPVSSLGREIQDQIKRLCDIHEATLHFKIARFQHKNPGFEYNLENI